MQEIRRAETLAEAHAKSYNYLRVGLIGAALLIGVSVAIEANVQDCFKGSISAYYHTPVRAMFVGGLIAAGFGLIVLRGKPDIEDTLLNLAGMMAPIVAVVPASEDGLCSGVVPAGDERFTQAQEAAISNNIQALFWVGVAALVVGAVLGLRARAKGTPWRPGPVAVGGLVAAGAILAVTFGTYRFANDVFLDNAHFTAAVVMFVLLGLTSLVNGREHDKIVRSVPYRRIYSTTAVFMLVGGALIVAIGWGDDRMILVLEIYEMALFVFYWSVQTKENWGRDARTALLVELPTTGREVAAAGADADDRAEELV
ncbi:MAG: hypothetical protein AAGA93_04855 [Actinomycetota bacterium]